MWAHDTDKEKSVINSHHVNQYSSSLWSAVAEREAESRAFVFQRIKFLIFYSDLEWTQVLSMLDKCSAIDLYS